jgi:hypothetical protein
MDLSQLVKFNVAFGKPMHQYNDCNNGIFVVNYSAVHQCCWQESMVNLMMTLFGTAMHACDDGARK